MQLLIFEETSEQYLERKVRYLENQIDKYRKGQFARISELAKLYQETKYELETLKSAMSRCKSL